MHRTNLFIPDTSVMLAPFSGKEDKLIEHFPDCPLSFRTQDLFKPFAVDRTYDIAFVSNILEYAKGNDEKLAICRDNLNSLLRSDGFVIATSFMNSSFDDFAKEREIFSSSFDFIEGKGRMSSIWEKPVDTYYVYQKK